MFSREEIEDANYREMLQQQRALAAATKEMLERVAAEFFIDGLFPYRGARRRFKKLDLVDTIAGAAKLALWVVLEL